MSVNFFFFQKRVPLLTWTMRRVHVGSRLRVAVAATSFASPLRESLLRLRPSSRTSCSWAFLVHPGGDVDEIVSALAVGVVGRRRDCSPNVSEISFLCFAHHDDGLHKDLVRGRRQLLQKAAPCRRLKYVAVAARHGEREPPVFFDQPSPQQKLRPVY